MKHIVIEELCDWLYKANTKEVLGYDVIARKAKELGQLREVTQEKLGNLISRCRTVMELRYKTTLINVPGLGYKLADPDELALHTAKWVKRTILYADRTYRLVDITDRKRIPGAIKKVFLDNEGRIRTLSARGKQFVSHFVEYSKKKQLEDKRGKENGSAKENKG